jgi:hypothetical protein
MIGFAHDAEGASHLDMQALAIVRRFAFLVRRTASSRSKQADENKCAAMMCDVYEVDGAPLAPHAASLCLG